MQNEESYNRNERRNLQYRPYGELVRGIFFILFGLFALFADKLGIYQSSWPPIYTNIAGAILVIYGLFRVVNGARKILSK